MISWRAPNPAPPLPASEALGRIRRRTREPGLQAGISAGIARFGCCSRIADAAQVHRRLAAPVLMP